MYATFLNRPQSNDDLAASLADRGLAVLVDMGMSDDSITSELRLWHSLRRQLERPSERAAEQDTSSPHFLKKLVCQAVQQVAGNERTSRHLLCNVQ